MTIHDQADEFIDATTGDPLDPENWAENQIAQIDHPGYYGHLGAMLCTKKQVLERDGRVMAWRIILETEQAGDPPEEYGTGAFLSISTNDLYLERVFAVGKVYALEIGTWPGRVVAHARET